MKLTTPFKSPSKYSMGRLGRWLDHRIFKNDVYILRGDEILPSGRGMQRFKVQDISTWQQVIVCIGVAYIVIKFADGRIVEFSDKHEDLLHILQRNASERELPWNAI